MHPISSHMDLSFIKTANLVWDSALVVGMVIRVTKINDVTIGPAIAWQLVSQTEISFTKVRKKIIGREKKNAGI